MALSILDGNQSATTLSTILSSGQHIPAHTVVSLGTQAITDIRSAVSGTSVCVGSISISGTPSVTGSVSVLNFPTSQSTTFGAVTGSVSVLNFPASQSVTFGATTGSVSVLNFPASQAVTFTDASLTNTQLRASAVTVGGTVTVGNSLTISSLPAISGTVTANNTNLNRLVQNGEFTDTFGVPIIYARVAGGALDYWQEVSQISGLPVKNQLTVGGDTVPFTVSGTVTANPTGTQTIAGSVTLGAGTAQIGSVTASISGTVPISISSVTVGNSVTIGSLPAISGTVTANINTFPDATTIGEQIAQGFTNYGAFEVVIGGTANVSGTVTANTFAVQGTAVTTSNFTSTTASTVLASYNATREVLTIFNEGAGNLHIAPGATCTTIAYQVRLSAGDYYEVPNHQTTITHSAVFATAGTARVTQVS